MSVTLTPSKRRDTGGASEMMPVSEKMGTVSVRLAEPTTFWYVARTDRLPLCVAVSRPVLAIWQSAGFDESHCAADVTSRVLPSDIRALACNW